MLMLMLTFGSLGFRDDQDGGLRFSFVSVLFADMIPPPPMFFPFVYTDVQYG
jgi:hypothetical protein